MGPRPGGLEPHPEGQGVLLFTEELQARSGCWLIVNSTWVEVGEPEGGLGALGWWLIGKGLQDRGQVSGQRPAPCPAEGAQC